MSSKSVMYELVHQEPNDGLIHCPHCNYKIPESLIVCWRCGEWVEKPESR